PVFFRRQPILADENDDLEGSNSLTKRIGAPSASGRVAIGEYRNKIGVESERNLYYPDISRIQSNAAVSASSSSSASASATAASSSNTNSVATFGVKGGASYTNQNFWQQSERLTSPVKSVRKVVKMGAQLLT